MPSILELARSKRKEMTEWKDEYYVSVFDFLHKGATPEQLPSLLKVSEKSFKKWVESNLVLRQLMLRAKSVVERPDGRRYQKLKPSQRRFLLAYEKSGTIKGAARASNLHVCNHYNWLSDNPAYHSDEYIKCFEIAQKVVNERIEAEIDRRAIKGIRKYKFHNGQPIMMETTKDDPEAIMVTSKKDGSIRYVKHFYELEYSDTLLIFKAKKEIPEYRDKGQMEVKHTGNVMIDIVQRVEEQRKAQVIDAEYTRIEAAKRIEAYNQSQEAEVG